MKHISPQGLKTMSALLVKLDELAAEAPALKLRKPGVYVLKSKAFLHFHEDGPDFFADVKLDGVTFERFKVNSKREQGDLFKTLRGVLIK